MRPRMLKRWAVAMVTVLSIALVGHRAAAEPASSVLEDILKIMRENGQITEAQKKALLQRAEQEAAQARAEREQEQKERVSALLAGIEGGHVFLKSADGAFRVELGGRLQIDYAAVEGNGRTLKGASLDDEFYARRARFELSGTFFRWVDLRVECESSPIDQKGSFCLNDGYLDFRFLPELALRAGQFLVPFGSEELTSDKYLDFVERSIVDELEPARDVGASLHGSLWSGIVAYDVGVFNGAGQNNLDTNGGKDVAGRLTLAPFKTTGNYWLKGLQVSGSAAWGDEGLGTSAQGRTTARGNARFTYFGAQTTNGDRTRLGTDLQWTIGPAALRFEYLEQLNQRRRLGSSGQNLDEVDAAGWFASAAWVVTGEDKPLNGPVVPRHPVSLFGGKTGLGAWELALRYAELSFDSKDPLNFLGGTGTQAVGPARTDGAEALTAGVNWYLTSRVRYMANWTHYWYDNPYATPLSCRRPGGCAAAQLRKVDDPASWEILSRIAFWF